MSGSRDAHNHHGVRLDATGTVTITDNGSPLDTGTFTINSAGSAEDQPIQLTGGTHALVCHLLRRHSATTLSRRQ